MGNKALMKKKIGILLGADITDGRTIRGGVVVVADFIIRQLLRRGIYEPVIISTPVSGGDKHSIRLLSPRSWLHGISHYQGKWRDHNIHHVGAFIAELEYQRYKPRVALTELLQTFDLIQVVSGSPAVAYTTQKADVPMCLQMATTAKLERENLLGKYGVIKRTYSQLMIPIISAFERSALEKAEHIFADTQYTAGAIARIVQEDKVTVDTIGVNTATFYPSAERSDDFLLCTGRLNDPRKNVPMLFKAFSLLRKMNRQCPRLVLAGMTGPTESDWMLAEALGIREHITFMESVPMEQLVNLYQNAACFLLTSDEEGLGIVLLEAMACGTPVVSTACGGPNSVVEPGTGILSAVDDPYAFANAVNGLLLNKLDRRSLGEMALKRVRERFADEIVAEKYFKVYDRILGI